MIGHYLMFNRNCAEALKLYTKAFNAKVSEIQTYGDMPSNPNFPIAENDKGLVLHARMQIDSTEIMCADASERSTSGDNMYISITTKDRDFILNAWNVLKQNARIYMELSPSFFAVLHGSLRDAFGINWMFTVSE